MKTQFKDLNNWLKAAVVWAYISMAFSVIAFIFGIQELMYI